MNNIKIFITEKSIQHKLKNLDLNYHILNISNNDLLKIIEIKKIMSKFNIKTTNLLLTIFKFYKEIKHDFIIIKLENDNLITYFKRIYQNINYISKLEEFIYLNLNSNINKEKQLLLNKYNISSEKYQIYNINTNIKEINKYNTL